MEAAATLAENIDNLVIPAMDTYRLSAIVAGAPTKGTITQKSHILQKDITTANAYEEFLAGQEILDDDKAPQGGRIVVASSGFYNKIKLDEHFTKKILTEYLQLRFRLLICRKALIISSQTQLLVHLRLNYRSSRSTTMPLVFQVRS